MELQYDLLVTATTTIFLICGIKFRWFRATVTHEFAAHDDKACSFHCAVCLNDVSSSDDKCREVLKCDHVFHVECVDAWLKSKGTCPLCRRLVTNHLPTRVKGIVNSILSHHLVSRADDFITDKIYEPITQTLTAFLFKGVVPGPWSPLNCNSYN